MKIDIDKILETSIGVLIAAGVLGAGLLIANRIFGLFAYASLSPTEVDKVAKQYDKYKIVTRVCDSTHCRGVYDMGGTLYYYKWEFGKSYEIFPLVYERYTTDNILWFAPSPKLVLP